MKGLLLSVRASSQLKPVVEVTLFKHVILKTATLYRHLQIIPQNPRYISFRIRRSILPLCTSQTHWRLFSSLFIVSPFVFHLITQYLIQLNHRCFHSVCPRSQESYLRLCGVRIGPKYRDLFNRQNREISCWVHNWERKLFRPVRI